MSKIKTADSAQKKLGALRLWYRTGEPWIWLSSSALAVCLMMVVGLLAFIFWKGLQHFWVGDVWEVEIKQNGKNEIWLGEEVDREIIKKQTVDVSTVESKTLYKIGNREEYALDFRWLDDAFISRREKPVNVAVIERYERGNAYGYFSVVEIKGESSSEKRLLTQAIQDTETLQKQIQTLQKKEIGGINANLLTISQERRKISADLSLTEAIKQQYIRELDQKKAEKSSEYKTHKLVLDKLYEELNNQGEITLMLVDGRQKKIPLSDTVRIYFPNDMSIWDKMVLYLEKLWEFIADDPREANTAGGIFPSIFGTVVLVLLMTIFVAPLGIITAIYLSEYAKQGFVVRLLRISVNNLAGIPSIVYGVFGLGFFVYFLGGKIDELFFNFDLPSPTFGSPNLLWASLTLALLTLPVVIVATEEGLNRVPRSIREGSLALGATQFETLWRTVIPMVSPALMTGVILAIARAAGEVAPLMLVGVVKLAPDLAIDGTAPYLHLDRQFMHLGFHIFDLAFQSPNIEAARPLVYATATLLIVIVLLMNITAIRIRNRLRAKYKLLES